MTQSPLAALSFGGTLALVVGVRLSESSLLLVAASGLALLLRALWLAVRAYYLEHGLPEIWVERARDGGLGRGAPQPILEGPVRARPRRGGWPHLERLLHPAEPERVRMEH